MQNIKNAVNAMLAEQCRVTEMEANKKNLKKTHKSKPRSSC